MAGKPVMLLRPGQEILIEREDLEPVLESLKAYGDSAAEEYAGALQSAREKIERCFRQCRVKPEVSHCEIL